MNKETLSTSETAKEAPKIKLALEEKYEEEKKNLPPEPEPYIQPNQPTPPPLPAEGLPNGWTMEQWNYYGQQWLEAQM